MPDGNNRLVFKEGLKLARIQHDGCTAVCKSSLERFLQIPQTHLQQTAAVILVSEDKRSPYALQNGSAASQNIPLAIKKNILYCEFITVRI